MTIAAYSAQRQFIHTITCATIGKRIAMSPHTWIWMLFTIFRDSFAGQENGNPEIFPIPKAKYNETTMRLKPAIVAASLQFTNSVMKSSRAVCGNATIETQSAPMIPHANARPLPIGAVR